MKKLSLLFFVFFISFSFGQTKENEITTNPLPVKEVIKGNPDNLTIEPLSVSETEDKIYETAAVEVKPEFPGGINQFYAFVAKRYQMPNKEGLNGKVKVTFVVEKDGTLTDFKILSDIGYETGKEAIRVLKSSPKWSPGVQNGKKVRCLYNFPITIKT